MKRFLDEIRYALRVLAHRPVLTSAALASLGLGIGANTAIFSVVDAVLLQSLPVREVDRLYGIYTRDGSNPDNQFIPVSFPNFEDLRDQARSFDALTAVGAVGFQLSTGDGDDEPEGMPGEIVTANYFQTLGVEPEVGRVLQIGDDESSAGGVAVLSHALWMRVFAGDPAVIGRTVRLNDHPVEVVGVTPPGFKGTQTLGSPDRIWVNWSQLESLVSPQARFFFENRRALPITVVGRLAPGVERSRAESELSAISRRLEEAYPDANRARTLVPIPLQHAAVGVNQRSTLAQSGTVLLGTVGIVLLIACANLANLMLARVKDRSRELALRAALGATRWDLVRQMLVESLVLSLGGGLAGLFLAGFGSEALVRMASNVIPSSTLEAGLDERVLLFSLGLSLLTGLLVGLFPAVTAARPDIHGLLKEAGRQRGGLARSPLRSALVVAEVAFAVVGLTGAGLFIRSMQAAAGEDFGYETRGLAVMTVSLAGGGYDPDEAVAWFREARRVALEVRGVREAGFTTVAPLTPSPVRTMVPQGGEAPDRRGSFVNVISVMPGYFGTLGILPVLGRGIDDPDLETGARPVAVVNESLARRYWPDQDPLGQRFSFYADEPVREVVGVVPDVTFGEIGVPDQPAAYLPYSQWFAPFGVLHLRVEGDEHTVLAEVRQAVLALDPERPVDNLQTAEELLRDALWARRVGAGMVGLFGIVALAMALLGIHAVVSYAVVERRHEIGVRLALGARPGQVFRMVVRQGMLPVILGVGAGLVVALVLSRLVAGLLYGVAPEDPTTLVVVAFTLGATALGACVYPALRSTRTSPLEALEG